MLSAARKLQLAGLTVAIFAIAAAPASATSVQTQAGAPYTGPLNGVNSTDFVINTDFGSITCNQSSLGGQVTDAGGTGIPAAGQVEALGLTHNGAAACPTNILLTTHRGFTAETPSVTPWPVQIDWIDDNTSGNPNATFTIDNFQVRADLTVSGFGDIDCTYVGNANGTAGTTKQLVGDLLNPDNAPSTNTELRLANEPFTKSAGDPLCPDTANATSTYNVTGLGNVKLQVRESPPAGGGGDPGGGSPPATPTTPQTAPASAQEDPKCKRLRQKRKRQKRNLASKVNPQKRAQIQANIEDTKKRLKRLGCQ